MLTAARKIQRKEVTEHYKDLINVSFCSRQIPSFDGKLIRLLPPDPLQINVGSWFVSLRFPLPYVDPLSGPLHFAVSYGLTALFSWPIVRL